MAIDDGGKVTHTHNRVARGWEGFKIESAGNGVYFLVRNKDNRHVLACDQNGTICTTTNKVANGWEGWRLERA